ncbi:hypothetical protein GCM10019994_35820 [Enterococcus raffinosus]
MLNSIKNNNSSTFFKGALKRSPFEDSHFSDSKITKKRDANIYQLSRIKLFFFVYL